LGVPVRLRAANLSASVVAASILPNAEVILADEITSVATLAVVKHYRVSVRLVYA